MADRPKISVKPQAAARDPLRRPVRALSAPRPPARPKIDKAPASQVGDGPKPAPRSSPDRRQDQRVAGDRPPQHQRVEARREDPRPDAPRRDRTPPAQRQDERRGERTPLPPEQFVRPPPAAPASAGPPPSGVRISKLITERGLASRREADEWIEAGWVKVGGEPAVLGQRVPADAELEIHPLAHTSQARRVTVLINKPIGLVSGQAEDGYEPAVTLFKPTHRWAGDASGIQFHPGQLRGLAPAGRLDIDSTGLLVLTQDGRVARHLIGDETRVEKEYLVRVERIDGGNLAEVNLNRLQHGLELDGVALRPARVSWQNEEQLRFVLREGRKRQIRRMCELVGLKVTGLKRVRIGSVALGQLPLGQWRYLGEHERF